MKVLSLNIILLVTILTSCSKPCYQNFSQKDIEFIAYDKGQVVILIDTNNILQKLQQTKYRRELFESCGSISCSGEHKEVYEVEYRSITDPEFGFNLNLYAQSCDGEVKSTLSVVSDALKEYKANRWIVAEKPDFTEIKYDMIVINGFSYTDVYEFIGYSGRHEITMLFNHQFGIIQIKFFSNKTITLVQ